MLECFWLNLWDASENNTSLTEVLSNAIQKSMRCPYIGLAKAGGIAKAELTAGGINFFTAGLSERGIETSFNQCVEESKRHTVFRAFAIKPFNGTQWDKIDFARQLSQ